MSEELEPCPFCGHRSPEVWSHSKAGHAVRCRPCGTFGPLLRSKAKARAAWNTRAEATRKPSAARKGVRMSPVARLREALADCRTFHEECAKALSEWPQTFDVAYRRAEHNAHIEAIDKALAAAPVDLGA